MGYLYICLLSLVTGVGNRTLHPRDYEPRMQTTTLPRQEKAKCSLFLITKTKTRVKQACLFTNMYDKIAQVRDFVCNQKIPLADKTTKKMEIR